MRGRAGHLGHRHRCVKGTETLHMGPGKPAEHLVSFGKAAWLPLALFCRHAGGMRASCCPQTYIWRWNRTRSGSFPAAPSLLCV